MYVGEEMTFPELLAYSLRGQLLLFLRILLQPYETTVNPQYFLSSVVGRTPRFACVRVFFPWVCASDPFFWKHSGGSHSLESLTVWSVGVMSFAAFRRGVRTACLQFPWEKMFGVLFCFVFFLKTRNRKEAFELREALSFAVGSLCCLEGTLPRLLHPPWMTTNIPVSPAGSLRGKSERQTMVNCTDFLLQHWVDLSSVLERLNTVNSHVVC